MMKLASILFAALATAGAAQAASHQINIAPVRAYVQAHLVDARTHTLKLNNKLDPAHPGAGITPQAVAKATQTLRGVTGFNSGTVAGNYVAKMGNEKIVITASRSGQKVSGIGYESPGAKQQFVIRSGKQGLVIARGNLDKASGALSWTRSHNEHSPSTPSETTK